MAKTKENWNVLPEHLGGGPHGLGDPNDTRLRKVEREILIPQKMRHLAKTVKCTNEVAQFHECCMEHGVALVFKCQDVNKVMKDCLTKWYRDPEFVQQCTNEYLEERSEYRRTGIGKKHKRIPNNM